LTRDMDEFLECPNQTNGCVGCISTSAMEDASQVCHVPSFDTPHEVVHWPQLVVFARPMSGVAHGLSEAPMFLDYCNKRLVLRAVIFGNNSHFNSCMLNKDQTRWCFYEGLRDSHRNGNHCFSWYLITQCESIMKSGHYITSLLYEPVDISQEFQETSIMEDDSSMTKRLKRARGK